MAPNSSRQPPATDSKQRDALPAMSLGRAVEQQPGPGTIGHVPYAAQPCSSACILPSPCLQEGGWAAQGQAQQWPHPDVEADSYD